MSSFYTRWGCAGMRSKGEMCRRFFLVVQSRGGASSHPSVNPGWYKCPRTTSHPLLMLSPHLDTASANKLASLEATLVRNSAHPLTYPLTDRGKV